MEPTIMPFTVETDPTEAPIADSQLRGDTVEEAKATLTVVSTRLKRALFYSMTENAILCSLPWTQVVNFISKGTIFCSFVPESA